MKLNPFEICLLSGLAYLVVLGLAMAVMDAVVDRRRARRAIDWDRYVGQAIEVTR